MTMSGSRRIGISDPKCADRKKLMVFVGVRVVIRSNRKAPDGDAVGITDYTESIEEEQFSITEVQVPLRPEVMPGKPILRAVCNSCCEPFWMDGRLKAGASLSASPILKTVIIAMSSHKANEILH